MITNKNISFLARFGSEEHANQIMELSRHGLAASKILKNPGVKSFSYDTKKKLLEHEFSPWDTLDILSKDEQMRALHDDDMENHRDNIYEKLTLHNDLNEDDVVKLLKRPESTDRTYVSRSLIRKAAQLNSDKVKEQIFHPDSPELHLRKYALYSHDDDRLLNHENPKVRDNYATSPNISRDHVSKLLKDKDHKVVFSAIDTNHHKIDTPTLTDLAKNHPSEMIRRTAEEHL